MGDSLRDALENLEQAVAGALETVAAIGTAEDFEKTVRLLNQKKVISEMLIEKIDMLEVYGNFRPKIPQFCLWDYLMSPGNNGTNGDFFL